MSWEKEPQWAKARLFFERAFEEPREDPLFGLWCSLGLELLARAAIASVNPALLAEPDPDHKNVLQALNLVPAGGPRKSLGIARVLNLCRTVFPKFSEDDRKVALALANRRNDELHSGASAFTEYPPNEWLVSFYHACGSLTDSMGETLESLFGKPEADLATEVLSQNQSAVKSKVMQQLLTMRNYSRLRAPSNRDWRPNPQKSKASNCHASDITESPVRRALLWPLFRVSLSDRRKYFMRMV